MCVSASVSQHWHECICECVVCSCLRICSCLCVCVLRLTGMQNLGSGDSSEQVCPRHKLHCKNMSRLTILGEASQPPATSSARINNPPEQRKYLLSHGMCMCVCVSVSLSQHWPECITYVSVLCVVLLESVHGCVFVCDSMGCRISVQVTHQNKSVQDTSFIVNASFDHPEGEPNNPRQRH